MSAAEADVADDALFEEAAAANLTLLREGEVVAGYQCYENGSILVPLADGGNQTVHSPEDVNANIHKVRENEFPLHERGGRPVTNCREGQGRFFRFLNLDLKKVGANGRESFIQVHPIRATFIQFRLFFLAVH